MSSFLRAKQCKLKEDSRHISTTDGEIWIHAVRLAYSYPYLLTVADDGTLTLRLRMPDCLAEEYGKYLVIDGVWFAYGHEQVLAALASNADYAAYRREPGEKTARATALGQAISYRFKRDGKGWRVFATTELAGSGDNHRPPSWRHRGGSECGPSGGGGDRRFGQLHQRLASTAGDLRQEHQRQAEALIGDAVASVVQYAREVGKPIVIEKLDFRQKKAALEGESRRYSRMLSSFSYGKIKAYFLSRGYRQGVEIPSGQPGLQFRHWPGEVHGAIRADGTPGCGLGAGPTLAWLLRAHPPPVGGPHWQWRTYRLHRTREEAREARVDVLGCCFGAAETGACSATPAGEAETPTQSGSGCREW